MGKHQDQIEQLSKELTALIYEGNVAAVGLVIILREEKLARTMSRC